MDSYNEPLLTKTKIVATVGPASQGAAELRSLVLSGVDLFRINFAHADHDINRQVVASIREIAAELERPVGILGDLAGPKIRLGELPSDGLQLSAHEEWWISDHPQPDDDRCLSTTYDRLTSDLNLHDRLLLADGAVALRVVELSDHKVRCVVEQSGRVRSRQGVNLPDTPLKLASMTEKDHEDLLWALQQRLDFLSLSFVRSAADLQQLRRAIEQSGETHVPFLVAKIEKPQAIQNLDEILEQTDAVMVARGDLGVEMDIVQVPTLQKQIINACNQRRIPVITATQMLESMIEDELPTRAEVTDVANAVLDGTDAVMLSAETAVGQHPQRVVSMMSRIVCEAEKNLQSRKDLPFSQNSKQTTTELTRAVARGAIYAAEQLGARLIVVLTRSGSTALSISESRCPVPIVALTDQDRTAQRCSITWGVRTLVNPDVCTSSPKAIAESISEWGRRHELLGVGDRFVVVGSTDWNRSGKDFMLVHAVDESTA